MSTLVQLEPCGNEERLSAERSLTQAFASFTEAAGSLERSYHQLERELARLRRELEERNRELARSLEENRTIRNSLHRILEGLPCGVLVVEGRSGDLSAANPAALRLLEPAEAPPQNLAQLRPELRTFLEQARSSSGEWEMETNVGGGEPRCLAAWHSSLGDAGGTADSVFILQDVSDRKRLALERERHRRQQALAEMSAVLAHEIRNPLGSLELFAGLLAESGLAEEPRSWVEHLQAGLRMLEATVNNVLHFHNAPSAQIAPTDLGQLLDWVGHFLAPLAKQSGVQLSLDHRLAGVELPADRHRLEQVLLNLAVNAIRFAPGAGSLWLSGRVDCRGPGEVVQIAMADSGPGIAPEHLGRIFDAGYTTRPGSPGLGLTVCKTIVEQHGGTIEAANRPQGGAAFTLRFPLGEVK